MKALKKLLAVLIVAVVILSCLQSSVLADESCVHNYVEISITPATCTDSGKVVYECTLCGATYIDDTPLLGHSYEITKVAEGTKYTCTRCGYSAIDKGNNDDFQYVPSTADTAMVTGYTGTLVDIVIPDVIKGYRITSIKAGTFNNSEIESVTIPKTIEILNASTFVNCAKLKTVYYYAENAVYNNKTLDGDGDGWTDIVSALPNELVDLDDAVESIDNSAVFKGCTGITTIEIKNGVKSMPEMLFVDCVNLATVKCCTSLKKVETTTFYKKAPYRVYCIFNSYFSTYAGFNAKKRTYYTLGDSNDDGKVTMIDLILAARYAVGWDNIQVNDYALDITTDGMVDSMDINIIERTLAHWKNYKLAL